MPTTRRSSRPCWTLWTPWSAGSVAPATGAPRSRCTAPGTNVGIGASAAARCAAMDTIEERSVSEPTVTSETAASPAQDVAAQEAGAPTPSSAVVTETDLNAPELYLNRELQLLAFQERVLEEAEDPGNPLLERAKFLAIFSSQHGRVLHGADRRPQAAGRGGRPRGVRRRAHAQRATGPRVRDYALRLLASGRASSTAPSKTSCPRPACTCIDYDELGRGPASPWRTITSPRPSSRCSRRSRSTPPGRSRISRTCRSTWRCSCGPRTARTGSRA